jgi:hypothetical protein
LLRPIDAKCIINNHHITEDPMCFSAAASFGLGSVLLPIGAYCTVSAYRKNHHYLLLACIPIMFGLQQIMEGFVWTQLHAGNVAAAYSFAYAFLFFAFAFWPVCIPASIYLIEDDPVVQKILKFFLIAGPILAIVLYGPILLGYVPIKVAIFDHAIYYDMYESKALLWTYSIWYGIVIIIPPLISSRLKIKLYGLMVFISLLISYWWYFYQFTSVWCFFAALLSVYIGFIMYRLKRVKC